jgi:hypothetical protein
VRFAKITSLASNTHAGVSSTCSEPALKSAYDYIIGPTVNANSGGKYQSYTATHNARQIMTKSSRQLMIVNHALGALASDDEKEGKRFV